MAYSREVATTRDPEREIEREMRAKAEAAEMRRDIALTAGTGSSPEEHAAIVRFANTCAETFNRGAANPRAAVFALLQGAMVATLRDPAWATDWLALLTREPHHEQITADVLLAHRAPETEGMG